MSKFLYTILLILSTFVINAQESILIPNTNIDAKELVHSLNKTNDSLVLNCDYIIYKVEIFNSEYMKIYEINKKEIQLPLTELPLGRFSIAVFTNRKIIMINLLRNKPYTISKPVPRVIKDTTPKVIPKLVNERTVYDTIRYKNIINKKYTVIYEDIINETYDTIRNIQKSFKVKDTTITIRSIPYNISTKRNDYRVIKQTREDFRKYNLRPNGTPYPEKKDN